MEQPQPGSERRVWSADEDVKIVALVGEHGTRAWSVIAAQLPTRTGKQCRERWHNQLDPNITKTDWSAAEDEALLVGEAGDPQPHAADASELWEDKGGGGPRGGEGVEEGEHEDAHPEAEGAHERVRLAEVVQQKVALHRAVGELESDPVHPDVPRVRALRAGAACLLRLVLVAR